MRLITLAAALALVAAPAFAATDRGGMGGMLPAFDFDAADTDGDGMLSRDEFAAHLAAQGEAMRAARLDRQAAAILEAGDADGDGTLDAEELRAGLEAVHATRMDTQRDWRQRRAERSDTRAERSENWAKRHADRVDRADRTEGRSGPRGYRHRMMWGDRASMVDRMFGRIDTDGDGAISAEEFAAAEARWQNRMQRRRPGSAD